MSKDLWLEETYFDWLRSDAFSETSERREYEGVLRVLHDIPFYWILRLDENRAGDALSFRQKDFLETQKDLDSLDQQWLHAWATAAPSVLEVLLGMARRWAYFFEGSIPYFFGHLFLNLGLQQFPGRHLRPESVQAVQHLCEVWLSRQFNPNGDGSPFPIQHALNVVDFRTVDMWAQMNAFSAEHFQ